MAANLGTMGVAGAAPVPLAQMSPSAYTFSPGSDVVEENAYASDFGTSLATADAHLAIQAAGHDLVQALTTALGADYAGVWFDNSAGRFKIGMVPGASETAVAQVLDARGLGSKTDLVPVASTWRQLEDQRADVLRANGVGVMAGTTHVGIDPTRNAVSVEVSSAAMPAVREDANSVAQTAADDPKVDVRTAPAASFDISADGCSFPYCDRPLRGGVQIYNDRQAPGAPAGDVSACTAGFLATRGGFYYILTAGHCIADGGNWYSQYADGESKRIGSSGGYLFGSSGDVGAINVPDTSPWVMIGWTPETAAWNVDLDHWTTAISSTYAGEFACHFGGTSGNPVNGSNCGYTNGIGYYVTYTDGTVVGPINSNTACALKGDSGGPVIDGNTGIGLASGGTITCGAGQETFFEDAPRAASIIGGVTIATTG